LQLNVNKTTKFKESANFSSLTANSAESDKQKNKMEAKTSNKQTTPSSQLNITIAKGKRKEESVGLALSLQDVFSDSANLAGMQQKTSRLSATRKASPKPDRGKWAQLGGFILMSCGRSGK
jgi:hypothetical protein